MDRLHPRKFAGDIKLSGAVDMLGGKDAIKRNLDKPEGWAHAKLMKFSKAKYARS